MTKPHTVIAPILMLFALLAIPAWAVEPIGSLAITEDSKLWIEGDSSIHKFESYATVLKLDSVLERQVDASNAKDPTLLRNGDDVGKVTSLALTIPIKEMKSPTIGLSSQMHKALKYKEYPNIVFTMQSYDVQQDAEQTNQYSVLVNGGLSIAGVTNTVDITMTGDLKDDLIEVTGEKDVNMTDFGITPPTLMFGRIKVYDKIVVKWELKIKLETTEGRTQPTRNSVTLNDVE